MGGGSGEEQQAAAQQAATQQPVAQALQMAQYPAYMPGQQEALASQMANFYGPGDYAAMLGNNTQSASRPTLRNPTDIETYLNNLANPASGSAASAAAQAAQAPAASPYEQPGLNQWGNPTFMGNSR